MFRILCDFLDLLWIFCLSFLGFFSSESFEARFSNFDFLNINFLGFFSLSGFNFFGRKVFDLSKPFSYFEAFSTILIVCGISFLVFLLLAYKAKKMDDKNK